MKRRSFLRWLGRATAASAIAPLAATAQPRGTVRRVGVLMPYPADDAEYQIRVKAFRQELSRLGWNEAGNLVIDERWTTDDMIRVRTGVEEILLLKPDAIVVSGRRVVAVLQERTRTVPVVFAGISDPVETGVVPSLARPGGNLTGFTLFEYSMIGKMLEMLKRMSPGIDRAALIFSPDNPATVLSGRSFETSAPILGIQPTLSPVRAPAEIESAIETFARRPNGALLFPSDVTITLHRELVTRLALQHRLPAIYGDPVLVASGGLMSYGPDRIDIFRQSAGYVDRILRGEKPGDLPVQNPTRFQLVLNLRTARALGLDVPPTLLAIADGVIE